MIQFDNLEWTCMDIGINIKSVSIGIYFSLKDPKAIQIELYYIGKKILRQFFDLGFYHSKKENDCFFVNRLGKIKFRKN